MLKRELLLLLIHWNIRVTLYQIRYSFKINARLCQVIQLDVSHKQELCHRKFMSEQSFYSLNKNVNEEECI